MTSLLRITLCSTALLLPATTYAVHALPPELSSTFYRLFRMTITQSVNMRWMNIAGPTPLQPSTR